MNIFKILNFLLNFFQIKKKLETLSLQSYSQSEMFDHSNQDLDQSDKNFYPRAIFNFFCICEFYINKMTGSSGKEYCYPRTTKRIQPTIIEWNQA
ncbi:hypothetical protein DERP_003699 [Dermatophagoides pteronyssinus]|uniref:Uncharacterized protein n=1 Tax=Dermatophagoides pteronyssinus TaxID=6956 RepID=A0ABQ8JLW1_DERPT|nr:hypothetical protein DERP_003699 [Dermatophagoides pteronyssinus]